MPIIPRIKKSARLKIQSEAKNRNACLNLLTWLKELQQKHGIESECEFEQELGLPPNTLNHLRLFMRPSIPLALQIAESGGINFERYMEIMNHPRKDNTNIQHSQRGWRRWAELIRIIKEDIRLNLFDLVEVLQTGVKKCKNLIYPPEEPVVRNEKGEAISLAGALIQYCIEQLNWKDADIKARLDYFASLGNKQGLLSWETFDAIRTGSRGFADDWEVTAMSVLLDPYEMAVTFLEWQIVQNWDNAHFKPEENSQINPSEEQCED